MTIFAGCGSSRLDEGDTARLPSGLYYAGLTYDVLPLTHADDSEGCRRCATTGSYS